MAASLFSAAFPWRAPCRNCCSWKYGTRHVIIITKPLSFPFSFSSFSLSRARCKRVILSRWWPRIRWVGSRPTFPHTRLSFCLSKMQPARASNAHSFSLKTTPWYTAGKRLPRAVMLSANELASERRGARARSSYDAAPRRPLWGKLLGLMAFGTFCMLYYATTHYTIRIKLGMEENSLLTWDFGTKRFKYPLNKFVRRKGKI